MKESYERIKELHLNYEGLSNREKLLFLNKTGLKEK